MKTLGLALGGGGLRGAAHIGVLQVMHGYGIIPSYVSGTSAGAVVAACYAAGMTPKEMEEEVLRLRAKDYLDYDWQGLGKLLGHIFAGRPAHFPAGFLKGSRLEELLARWTKGKRLSEAGLPLAIVATDLTSGKRVIFTNQRFEVEDSDTIIIREATLSEAVRASASIPVTFVPKELDGLSLVDGALKDAVPVRVLKIMGADYVLAVNLQSRRMERPVRDVPGIVTRSIDIMVEETSFIERQLFADMEIQPEVEKAGLSEVRAIPGIIRAGRRAMRERVGKLKNELAIR